MHVHSNAAKRACQLYSRAWTRLVQYVTVCFVIDQSADRGPLGSNRQSLRNILSNDIPRTQHKKHIVIFYVTEKCILQIFSYICSNYRHLNSSCTMLLLYILYAAMSMSFAFTTALCAHVYITYFCMSMSAHSLSLLYVCECVWFSLCIMTVCMVCTVLCTAGSYSTPTFFVEPHTHTTHHHQE